MSDLLTHSYPGHAYPDAHSISQQTAHHLRTYGTINSFISVPFLTRAESPEVWATYEKLFISCLETGDDESAHQCLEKLIARFGATNERIMGLRGLYQEAVAEGPPALEKVLKHYDDTLVADPANIPVTKRRIALLRSLGRISEAISALVALLEASPTDIESWAELSDLYLSQGLYPQAVYCVEEILLIAPNAWNIHARMGELLYLSTGNSTGLTVGKTLAESVRRFCRSTELCEGYLRGYYGLKLATDQLLNFFSRSLESTPVSSLDHGEPMMPSVEVVSQLNNKAVSALAEIIQRPDRGGLGEAEIGAVKKLLSAAA
jgi:tetratricopeptide (TPR) repeat protein